MDFNAIIGQTRIKKFLNKTIKSGNIAQSYLVLGKARCGKSTIVNAFAKSILCQNNATDDCNCKCCSMFRHGTHPDVKYIVSLEDKKSIGVNDIRHIINDVYISPYIGDKKVYICHSGDILTTQAQNALLKILEEPPEYAVFIIEAQDENIILPTIKSRSVLIEIDPYTYEDITGILTSDNKEFIFAFSDNNLGVALDLEKNAEFIGIRKNILDVLCKLLSDNPYSSYEIVEQLIQYKDDKDILFRVMFSFFSDMLYVLTANTGMLKNTDYSDEIYSLSEMFGLKKVIAIIEKINSTAKAIRINVNFDIALCNLLLYIKGEN